MLAHRGTPRKHRPARHGGKARRARPPWVGTADCSNSRKEHSATARAEVVIQTEPTSSECVKIVGYRPAPDGRSLALTYQS
jgi:hypothetical protein